MIKALRVILPQHVSPAFDPVGFIEDGETDRTLNEGLIGEWERILTEREKQEHSGES